MKTLQELFDDWASARTRLIPDYSGNAYENTLKIINEARELQVEFPWLVIPQPLIDRLAELKELNEL